MQNFTRTNLEAPLGFAIKDTLIDEYYDDLLPENIKAVRKALAINPYPGLRPFKTSENVVFFGREGISSELIERLADHRFLAVLGASGTGKSSLVRAGLLPNLETLPGKHSFWKVAICRPGKNPFGNLARAIYKAKITSFHNEQQIANIISSSSYGFEELYYSTDTPKEFKVLIIIDQFEEIFRYRKDNGVSGRNDVALFVKMLIEISQNISLNTFVMITMRSEYLGDCVQLPGLVEAINVGQYLVPRLKPKQLTAAIEGPTVFSGASVEDGFADNLIGEIGDNMDQLPVLQHALRRSYEESQKNTAKGKDITVKYEHYNSIGRMEHALDKHANEVHESLNLKQQKYCKILFQSLTDRATDGRGIRRPLPFLILLGICKENEERDLTESNIRKDLEYVIYCFRKENVNFLMPPIPPSHIQFTDDIVSPQPHHTQLHDDMEIDISHESLMRIWSKLKEWISDEAKDANLLKDLLNREKNDYIKGSKLVTYHEWLKRKNPGPIWASLYKPADIKPEEYKLKFISGISLINESQKKEKREKQVRSVILSSFILLILVVLGLYYSKYTTEKDANAAIINLNDKLTQSNSKLRQSNSLLTQSEDSLQRVNKVLAQNKDSLQRGNKILEERNNRIKTDSTNLAHKNSELNNTIDTLEQTKSKLILKQEELLNTSNLANNLKNLALAVKHSTKSLAIPAFDAERQDIKAQLALLSYKLLQKSGDDEKERFQPQIYSALYYALKSNINKDFNKYIVTPYQLGTDRLAKAALAKNQANESTIYLTAEDDNLYIFNLQSKKKEESLNIFENVTDLAANPTGKWLATKTLNELILIDNEGEIHRKASPGIVRTFEFSPDRSILYVLTKEDTLYKLNINNVVVNNNSYSEKEKINYKLEDIAVSNLYIYGLTSQGDLIKWRKDKHTHIDIVQNPSKEKLSRGTKISCTPNNSIIVWGNENGQVFYLREGSEEVHYLTRFNGPISDIAFNEDKDLLAIASFDKTVRIFKLPYLQSETPLILDDNEGVVTSLFFDSKDNNLIAVISPGIIKSYPLDLQKLACMLEELKPQSLRPNQREAYVDKAVDEQIINEQICNLKN